MVDSDRSLCNLSCIGSLCTFSERQRVHCGVILEPDFKIEEMKGSR